MRKHDINNVETRQVAIPAMFDNISGRYDSINHFLSFGIDRLWRRKFVSLIKADNSGFIVDVATGTAEIPLLITNSNCSIVAVDPAEHMLEIAAAKIASANRNNIKLIEAPAESIPLQSDIADIVSVSFGLRNFNNPTKGLSELYRITKKGGRCLILEFNLPKNRIVRNLYVFYLTGVLPVIGGLFSGNISAYRYLHNSIVSFAMQYRVPQELKKAGFSYVHQVNMTLGVVSIYIAEKPE